MGSSQSHPEGPITQDEADSLWVSPRKESRQPGGLERIEESPRIQEPTSSQLLSLQPSDDPEHASLDRTSRTTAKARKRKTRQEEDLLKALRAQGLLQEQPVKREPKDAARRRSKRARIRDPKSQSLDSELQQRLTPTLSHKETTQEEQGDSNMPSFIVDPDLCEDEGVFHQSPRTHRQFSLPDIMEVPTTEKYQQNASSDNVNGVRVVTLNKKRKRAAAPPEPTPPAEEEQEENINGIEIDDQMEAEVNDTEVELPILPERSRFSERNSTKHVNEEDLEGEDVQFHNFEDRDKAAEDNSDDEVRSSGPLSDSEWIRVTRVLNIAMKQHDIDQMTINTWLQDLSRPQTATIKSLWNDIRESLPRRDRVSIMRACRRKYNNFTSRGKWTVSEDEELLEAYQQHEGKWSKIGPQLDRMPSDCRDRWRNYLKCGTGRRTATWTPSEEEALIEAVNGCKTEIQRNRKFKARESGHAYRDQDWEKELNWGAVSEKMNLTRSRLQCSTHWKIIQKRSRKRGSRQTTFDRGMRFSTKQKSAYGIMKPADKYKILVQIAEAGVEDEGEISWEAMSETFDETSQWTIQDIQDVFLKMREKYAPNESDLSDALSTLISHFTSKYEAEELEPELYQNQDPGHEEDRLMFGDRMEQAQSSLEISNEDDESMVSDQRKQTQRNYLDIYGHISEQEDEFKNSTRKEQSHSNRSNLKSRSTQPENGIEPLSNPPIARTPSMSETENRGSTAEQNPETPTPAQRITGPITAEILESSVGGAATDDGPIKESLSSKRARHGKGQKQRVVADQNNCEEPDSILDNYGDSNFMSQEELLSLINHTHEYIGLDSSPENEDVAPSAIAQRRDPDEDNETVARDGIDRENEHSPQPSDEDGMMEAQVESKRKAKAKAKPNTTARPKQRTTGKLKPVRGKALRKARK